MALKAVIFDWSGTIVDCGSLAPVNAVRSVFNTAQVPVTVDQARGPMGKPKRAHIADMLADPNIARAWREQYGQDPSEADGDRLHEALEEALEQTAVERAAPIPGVLGAIEQLRAAGIMIGSTTGYARKTLDKLAPAAAALGYAPDVIIAGDEVEDGRPGPGMMLAAMHALGVRPEETIKVDDAAAGVAEGRAVGAYTFGLALTGTLAGLDEDQLLNLGEAEQQRLRDRANTVLLPAGADRIIDSVAGLADIVLNEMTFR